MQYVKQKELNFKDKLFSQKRHNLSKSYGSSYDLKICKNM